MPAAPKSKKGLKIALISLAALAVIATVVLILVFVVFAGDTGEAKDLMKKGDARMEEVQASGGEVGTALDELISSSDQITTAAEYEAQADKLRGQLKPVKASLKAAQKDYRAILSLKGVEDYKEYAGIVLELIDNNFELVREIEVYLDFLGKQFAAAEAGQAIDGQAFNDTTTAFIEKAQELGNQNDELKKKAVDFKKEKNLE